MLTVAEGPNSWRRRRGATMIPGSLRICNFVLPITPQPEPAFSTSVVEQGLERLDL